MKTFFIGIQLQVTCTSTISMFVHATLILFDQELVVVRTWYRKSVIVLTHLTSKHVVFELCWKNNGDAYWVLETCRLRMVCKKAYSPHLLASTGSYIDDCMLNPIPLHWPNKPIPLNWRCQVHTSVFYGIVIVHSLGKPSMHIFC